MVIHSATKILRTKMVNNERIPYLFNFTQDSSNLSSSIFKCIRIRPSTKTIWYIASLLLSIKITVHAFVGLFSWNILTYVTKTSNKISYNTMAINK